MDQKKRKTKESMAMFQLEKLKSSKRIIIIIITIIIIILYSAVSLLNQQRFKTVNDKEK